MLKLDCAGHGNTGNHGRYTDLSHKLFLKRVKMTDI